MNERKNTFVKPFRNYYVNIIFWEFVFRLTLYSIDTHFN